MKSILLFDIDGTLLGNSNSFMITEDVIESLSKLPKGRVGIFSQGVHFIQIAKLRFHALDGYFSKKLIYISLNKLKLLRNIRDQNPEDRIFIVDNRLDMVNAINESEHEIEGILIDRAGKHSDYPGAKIEDLSELAELVS